jgi:hypothetical protein
MKRLVTVALLGMGWMGLGVAHGQGAGPLYGPNGVSAAAVHKGVNSAGYFQLAVAAMATADPEGLRKAIESDTKAAYRVHFSGGPDELVFQQDVDALRARGLDRSEGDWVLVLMQAYSEHVMRQGLQALSQLSRDRIWRKIMPPLLEKDAMPPVAIERAVRSVMRETGLPDTETAELDRAWLEEQQSAGISPLDTANAGSYLGESQQNYRVFKQLIEQDGEAFGGGRCAGMTGMPARVREAFTGAGK